MANSEEHRYYQYDPSIAAAGIFTALFALSTVFHLIQMMRTKTWYLVPFVLGGLFEVVGFGARVINANQDPVSRGVYIIQALGILLAPSFFSASIYMEFGRIILLVSGEELAIIKKKWLTKLFVTGDIISFLAQLAGGAMLTQKTANSAKNGKTVIELGLGVQILFFGFFLFNILIFWRRIVRAPTPLSQTMPWKKHSTVLLVAGSIVLIRCLYRVIEYMQGETGELQSKEIYLYVLDAGAMLAVMLIFHYYHPSEVGSLLNGGKVAKMFKTATVEKCNDGSLLSDVEMNPVMTRGKQSNV